MSTGSEFREFLAKGNVVDLAVGVVIGAAFGKIVASLVDDIIMPPNGGMMGGVDSAAMKIVLKQADPAHKLTEVAIRYGVFINTIIQFIIVATVIFMIVQAVNRMRREKAAVDAAPAAPTASEALLTDIRDLLARSAQRP